MPALPARSRAASFVGVLVAVAIAAGLFALASAITRLHVGHAADRAIALYRHGSSPWQWTLRGRRDLVAQRVFGTAGLVPVARGLRLTSRGGTYEVGLPLRGTADLRRTALLTVDMRSTAPLELRAVIRRTLSSPECMAVLSGAPRQQAWNLRTLEWTHPDGRRCVTPDKAAMLRLNVHQASGRSLLLQRVALRPTAGLALPDPDHPLRLRAGVPVRAQLASLLPESPDSRWPVLEAPATLSPQRLLAWRDAIGRRDPSAVLLPHGWRVPRPLPVPASSTSSHLAVRVLLDLAYAVVLILLLWRRPGVRMRPWIDIGSSLLGPLCVIVGLQIGSPVDATHVLALPMGVLYAVALGIREHSADWRWFGSWPARVAPQALLLPTAILVLLFGHAWRTPAPQQVLTYLAWALLQQWLVLAFVMRRLESALHRPVTALLGTATLFALMHTPNARLMLLCFGAELFWGWCFLRWRALLPIAVAHAACALWLQAAVGDGWLRSLGISARYFMPG